MDLGECSTCITQNFDGLETRDRPDLLSRVVRLNGDNNTLACSAPKCLKLEDDRVGSYDARFLEGETILCPSCIEAGECFSFMLLFLSSSSIHTLVSARVNPRARIIAKPLRANVLLDDSIDPNVRWDRLLAEARNADTLLIAGASLKSTEAYCLLDELAQVVRSRDGAVVYINDADVMTTRLAHLIDFYLQVDVQACAQALLDLVKKVSTC